MLCITSVQIQQDIELNNLQFDTLVTFLTLAVSHKSSAVLSNSLRDDSVTIYAVLSPKCCGKLKKTKQTNACFSPLFPSVKLCRT